jgi:hypothetical protein
VVSCYPSKLVTEEVGSGNNASGSIQEIARSNLGRDYSDSSFHAFLQPLRKNTFIIQLPLPSRCFQFTVRSHQSLYTQYPKMLTSLSKLQIKGEVVLALN